MVGLAFLSFWVGAALTYYRFFPHTALYRATLAASALYETYIGEIEDRATQGSNRKFGKIKKGISLDQVNWSTSMHLPSKTIGGYTLVCPRGWPLAQLIDMEGNVVASWHSEPLGAPDDKDFYDDAHLFPNGDLLAVDHQISVSDRRKLVKLDKYSHVIWQISGNFHHDVHVDEEGNIFTLQEVAEFEKPSAPVPFNTPFMSDYVVKLSPEGKELMRFSVIEALLRTPYAHVLKKLDTQHIKGDMLHTNSVRPLRGDMADAFPQFKPGYLLISMRNISTLAVIDPQTKKAVWASSGPPWNWQHDVDFLPNGHIVMLDNLGLKGRENRSRVLEFDPVGGQVLKTSRFNRLPLFNTPFKGALDVLPEGTVMLNSSFENRVMEISPENELVWEASFPPGTHSYCGHRYTELDFLPLD